MGAPVLGTGMGWLGSQRARFVDETKEEGQLLELEFACNDPALWDCTCCLLCSGAAVDMAVAAVPLPSTTGIAHPKR